MALQLGLPNTIWDLLAEMDRAGAAGRAVQASARAESGLLMLLKAGGPEISGSARPAFTHYEVCLADETPRAWRKYTDQHQLVYKQVPRLVLANYTLLQGDLLDYDVHEAPPMPTIVKWVLAGSTTTLTLLPQVLEKIYGVKVINERIEKRE